MAKRPNQRLKLLYLAKIMLRLTDDEHGLQVEQIINELAKYDIAAERKSIYSDLEALQLFGIDIEKKAHRTICILLCRKSKFGIGGIETFGRRGTVF